MYELYKILEINYTNDLNLIKKSYYKLAKKYHPDKQNGSKDKFIQIKKAYDILSNNKLKKIYDEKECETNNQYLYVNYINILFNTNIKHYKNNTLVEDIFESSLDNLINNFTNN